MGIAKEFGLTSLNVPSSLFYGRRKRQVQMGEGARKEDEPEFPPPPPFVPLTQAAVSSSVPALLHAFFAQRIESGVGLADDEGFDPAHCQIGSLGQVVHRSAAAVSSSIAKKKREREGDAGKEEKKSKNKKTMQPGVGKGNWSRPSKEEKERRAAELESKSASQALGLAAGAAATATEGPDADGEGEEAE